MQGSSSLDIRDFFVPGPLGRIPVRLYLPATPLARGQKRPLVMYFHGGGFVSGSLEDADTPARFIAEHGQLAVLSVGYALAPAKPFPAAPEDAFAGATWACKDATELKGDLDRTDGAGDDAGR